MRKGFGVPAFRLVCAAVMMCLVMFMNVPGVLAAEDGLSDVACQELQFSTKVPRGCTTKYKDGDGLYIYTVEDGCIPYILVYVNSGDGRTRDGDTYLDEIIIPRYEENYRKNGAMQTIRHGEFTVGGRSVAAVDVEYYNVNHVKIYFLTVIDVRENFTAFYRVRYVEPEQRQGMLDALDIVAENLTLTGAAQASVGTPGSSGSPQQSGSAANSGDVTEYAITGIEHNGMAFGRCTAPEGYEVKEQVFCCTEQQSTSNPFLLQIEAHHPDGPVMIYCSARDYMQILNGDHQDGVFNQRYKTPQLQYMNAAQYCNYVAASTLSNYQLYLVEENNYPELDQYFTQQEQILYQLSNQAARYAGYVGIDIDAVEVSMCTRRYEYEAYGYKFTVCVTAASKGTQMRTSLPGLLTTISTSTILWEVPFVYTVICPSSQWEKVSAEFAMFEQNTSASDQFISANKRLGEELWAILNNRTDLYAAVNYSEQVMREETASGDDYNDERFTDYLFDQDDYTLSDGTHVKVPTSCPYVYEGDNGNVYASRSALDQPGGSTQLYPNY